MIVFDTYAERAEQYIITMQKLSTAAANMIEIESITPAADLVDGGKYNFRLTYQDGALNPPAAFDVVNVNYAGFETMTPNITLPVSSKKVLATFDVAFELFEDAAVESVRLIINPVNSGSNSGTFDGHS